jgi:hypothetical protein
VIVSLGVRRILVSLAQLSIYEFAESEVGKSKTNNMKWLRWLLLAAVMTSYAQDAEVNFANNVFFPPRLVSTFEYGPLTGTNFSAVLLYGTSASSLTAHTFLRGSASPPRRSQEPGTVACGH